MSAASQRPVVNGLCVCGKSARPQSEAHLFAESRCYAVRSLHVRGESMLRNQWPMRPRRVGAPHSEASLFAASRHAR